MNTRCPNCGAVHSLDSLLAHADTAELLRLLAELGSLSAPALRYLGLFRPAKSQLSFARAAKLLGELLPDIKRAAIRRAGTDCPAPPEAWQHGFQTAVEARDTGRLKLPLKSHGYLYEIISQWQPARPAAPQTEPPQTHAKPSQTLNAAAALQAAKKGGKP